MDAPRLALPDLKAQYLQSLDRQVQDIHKAIHPDGRYGEEPWIVRDQEVVFPLSVAFTTQGSRFYEDESTFEALTQVGSYLRKQQDEQGMYVFRKKDGSEWGDIFMPWTYLRWIFSYSLVGHLLEPEARKEWEAGLLLGYSGIAKTELTTASQRYRGTPAPKRPLREGEVIPWLHNIPTHHAAGLYLAGQCLERSEWMDQAQEFMALIVEKQTEHGWWEERSGPVVLYNQVYLESLSLYFHYSRDAMVGEALERGNRYHLHTTYPDGSRIETFDERNYYHALELVYGEDGNLRYHPRLCKLHPGFYTSREGRSLLKILLQCYQQRDEPIAEAAMMLHCLPRKGPLNAEAEPQPTFSMDDRALVLRVQNWVCILSAYTAPRSPNRFIQDRQNFLSLYHRKIGLILGGGSTKIQPLWSTLTVGDTAALKPQLATPDMDLAPDFAKAGVQYVPDEVSLQDPREGCWEIQVQTGEAQVSLLIKEISENQLHLMVERLAAPTDDQAMAVHLPLLPYLKDPVFLSDGSELVLSREIWKRDEVTSVRHHDYQLASSDPFSVTWPAHAHNPYTPDGSAGIGEARLVVGLNLRKVASYHLTLSVGEAVGEI